MIQRNSSLVMRNLNLGASRTTIRLEPELWDAFDTVCTACELPRHQLASRIAARWSAAGKTGAYTSAVRVAVLAYFRSGSGAGHARPAAVLEAALDAVGPAPHAGRAVSKLHLNMSAP